MHPDPLKAAVACQERFQHERNPYDSLYRIAISLRMQGRVTLKIGFGSCRTREGQPDDLRVGQRPQVVALDAASDWTDPILCACA